MAFIEKTIAAMSMPKALRRGNPVPLDASSIYYSYEAMAEYATNNAIAYVGQILSLIDEEKGNKVTAYIIADTAGTLKEVGSSAIGDQKSIVVAEDNTISIKGVAGLDFTKRGEDGEPELDDEGNELKVNYQPLMTEAGLVWVIPSETTVEGLGLQIDGLNTRVTKLEGHVGVPAEEGVEATGLFKTVAELAAAHTVDKEATEEALSKKLDLAGGTLTGDLVLADGHKAASEHVVDTKIAAAIESAGHLKRAVVEVLPDPENADPDMIYMLKNGLSLSGDVYDEYMLIDGSFELIGNTRVDLSDYAKKVEGAVENNLAALATDGALIDAGIALQDVADHLADEDKHITTDEREAWNEGAALAATNAQAIEDLVKISQEDADKLAALPVITEIGANLELTDGVLSAVAEQYELPAATADTLGGIKVGSGLAIDENGILNVPVVEANGLALSEEGLAVGLASESTAGAMSSDDYIKLANLPANAAANVVEGMVLGANEVAVEINDNKQFVLPFATANMPGVVISSEEDNHIAVDAVTGKMALNRISADKLYVAEGEEFVLNGGNSIV